MALPVARTTTRVRCLAVAHAQAEPRTCPLMHCVTLHGKNRVVGALAYSTG